MAGRPRAFTSDCLETRRCFTPPASPQQRPAADPAAPPKFALPARQNSKDLTAQRQQRLKAKREGAPDVFLSSSAPTQTVPTTLLDDFDAMQVDKDLPRAAGASESTAPSPAYDEDCAFDMEEDAVEDEGGAEDFFDDGGDVEFSLEVEGDDFGGENTPGGFVGSLGSLTGPSSFKASLPVVDGRARSLSFNYKKDAGVAGSFGAKDFTGSPVLSSCLDDLRKARDRANTEEHAGVRGRVGGP